MYFEFLYFEKSYDKQFLYFEFLYFEKSYDKQFLYFEFLYFERSYDEHNYARVVISYKIYQTRRRLILLFSYEMSTCVKRLF